MANFYYLPSKLIKPCFFFKQTFERHIEKNTVTAYSREFIETDFQRFAFYRNAKQKRDLLFKNHAKKSGVIEIKMVQAQKRKRDDDEILKTKKTFEMAEAKFKKRTNKT